MIIWISILDELQLKSCEHADTSHLLNFEETKNSTVTVDATSTADASSSLACQADLLSNLDFIPVNQFLRDATSVGHLEALALGPVSDGLVTFPIATRT